MSSPLDLPNRQFGRFGPIAGGICLPRKDVASVHPMQEFMSKVASLLASLLTSTHTERDSLLMELTRITVDAGVGSMVGKPVGECVISIKNWMRRSRLGFEPTFASTHQYLANDKCPCAELARPNVFFKKTACMFVAASQDLHDELSRLDFYYGHRIDADLNAWQMNILLLAFLKVPLRYLCHDLSQYAMHNVKKLLEVHVEGRHFFLSPEIPMLLAFFLGTIDRLPKDFGAAEGNSFEESQQAILHQDEDLLADHGEGDDEESSLEEETSKKAGVSRMAFLRRNVGDDCWQLCLASNCMPLALLLANDLISEPFDRQQYALYFGAIGLAEAHIHDVRYPLPLAPALTKESLRAHDVAELEALSLTADILGDCQLLQLLAPVSDGTIPLLERKLLAVGKRAASNALRLNYLTRPQVSVQFFHNRQTFLWPHAFVHVDESWERLSKKVADLAVPLVPFREEGSLRIAQALLHPTEPLLTVHCRSLLKFNLHTKAVHTWSSPSVEEVQLEIERGDALVVSYDEETVSSGALAYNSLSSLIANAGDWDGRERFLLLAVHVSSYASKDALLCLVE